MDRIPRRRALLLGTAALVVATALPTHAAAPASVGWSAFANIVVTGSGAQRTPSFQVTTLPSVLLSPESIECSSKFAQNAWFDVQCTTRTPPPTPDNTVTNDAWNCNNPMVVADISGPAPLESVTGTVQCAGSAASCSAAATTLTGTAWRGNCFGRGLPGPWPLRCSVDLSNVRIDNWQVTCYSTDP